MNFANKREFVAFQQQLRCRISGPIIYLHGYVTNCRFTDGTKELAIKISTSAPLSKRKKERRRINMETRLLQFIHRPYRLFLPRGKGSLFERPIFLVNFYFKITGRPDPPHNCSVVNLTQSWLLVKCLRGFDGGLPQEFICQVAREWNDKVISNITSKSQPEFRVTGLEARTSYAVVIYSANVKGKSKENVLLRITTLPNVTEQSRRSMGSYLSGNKT